jgi:cell division protein FtsW
MVFFFKKNNLARKRPDLILIAAVATMLLLGILILSSASALMSQARFGDSYFYLRHQVVLGILPGLFLGLLVYFIPTDFLRRWSLVLMAFTLALLVLIFIPGIGFQAGGAQRWVNLGITTVQPSEILKLVFIIYLASWLSSHVGVRGHKKAGQKEFSSTLVPFLIVVSLIGLMLLAQPDLSTFGIIAVIAMGMYFLAGTPVRHTFFVIFMGMALLALLVIFEPYRLERLTSWMSPESDPMGNGFQSSQALIMTGSGGVFGLGLGSSSAKYVLLPELIGDSVFAPFAQEIGFTGSLLLVGMFLVYTWRGFMIARASPAKFDYLAACGIVIWIALQSVINIASTTRLIPLSGVPLPFISYGGTAMAMELAATGLLLNISRHTE